MLETLANLFRSPAPVAPASRQPRHFGTPAGTIPACVDVGRPCHDHCACEPVHPSY